MGYSLRWRNGIGSRVGSCNTRIVVVGSDMLRLSGDERPDSALVVSLYKQGNEMKA